MKEYKLEFKRSRKTYFKVTLFFTKDYTEKFTKKEFERALPLIKHMMHNADFKLIADGGAYRQEQMDAIKEMFNIYDLPEVTKDNLITNLFSVLITFHDGASIYDVIF